MNNNIELLRQNVINHYKAFSSHKIENAISSLWFNPYSIKNKSISFFNPFLDSLQPVMSRSNGKFGFRRNQKVPTEPGMVTRTFE
jgi:hypothetical protein